MSMQSSTSHFLLLICEISLIEEIDEKDGITAVESVSDIHMVPSHHAVLALPKQLIGCIIAHQTCYHLNELKQSYGLHGGFWHLQPGRAQCVIRIHYRVDHVVHTSKPDRGCYEVSMAVPRIDEDCNMVVVVEEYERRLVEDEEHGVEQFEHFGQREEGRPQGLVVEVHDISPAHASSKTFLCDKREQSGRHYVGTHDAECGQTNVPKKQNPSQFVRLSLCHNFTADEDYE